MSNLPGAVAGMPETKVPSRRRARVQQAVGVPLYTNMCVVRLEKVAQAIRTRAIDVIQRRHAQVGRRRHR